MRFAILNTIEWGNCRAVAAGQLSEEEAMESLTGCAWLFRVEAEVENVEEAARDAVKTYFASQEGLQVIEREGIEALTWEEAILWVPDEIWKRHGLEPIRHPDVERVILDADEDVRKGSGGAILP